MGDPGEAQAHRPGDVTEAELLGGVEKRELVLADPDPTWPRTYAVHETRIREALGSTAIDVEHIGSTSVPGLAAKPIIDILVTVPDITAEQTGCASSRSPDCRRTDGASPNRSWGHSG